MSSEVSRRCVSGQHRVKGVCSGPVPHLAEPRVLMQPKNALRRSSGVDQRMLARARQIWSLIAGRRQACECATDKEGRRLILHHCEYCCETCVTLAVKRFTSSPRLEQGANPTVTLRGQCRGQQSVSWRSSSLFSCEGKVVNPGRGRDQTQFYTRSSGFLYLKQNIKCF